MARLEEKKLGIETRSKGSSWLGAAVSAVSSKTVDPQFESRIQHYYQLYWLNSWKDIKFYTFSQKIGNMELQQILAKLNRTWILPWHLHSYLLL